eukprot:comp16641_c0_seq1/m.26880 comp16641_c0_seq1/g.26880  ORF comp16641_c0_seq1/g.26880 comp16641_c0_seq1/m.26880 type:complete len:187 (-) comp16641_c0_seq1:132-692(-)
MIETELGEFEKPPKSNNHHVTSEGLLSREVVVCAAFVVLCLVVSFASSMFTRSSIKGWYRDLRKPSGNPPNWVFAPVWTTLYILIGIAGGKLWLARPETHLAMIAWWTQLVLNFFWSIIFFGMKQPGFAFAELLLMWGSIAATIHFAQKPVITYLLLPYIAWVSFAGYLNCSIWLMNPSKPSHRSA